MRPNILFIMSDDHATNGISAYGSRIAADAPTPNIDRIGNEGMRFENCHCTNSICTPSRATILTGLQSNNNDVRTLDDHLGEDQVLLSELLQAEGYETSIIGKWHLHAEPRGFDHWAVLPGQGLYNDPHFIYKDEASVVRDGKVVDPKTVTGYWPTELEENNYGVLAEYKGYVTNIITDLTLDWLDNRDQDKPFFLCCHHKAPHDFFEYEHQYQDLYEDTVFKEPGTLFEDEQTQAEISRKYGTTVSERWEPRNMVKELASAKNPNEGAVDFSGLDFEGKAKKAYQKYMKYYMRTVHSIDNNVGRILDYLDEHGLAENTIVIYTSDQGMMLGEHDHIDKRWSFDESQRMPFLVRYPKEIPSESVNRDIVDNVDFAPTLLDCAAAEIPSYMEGRSFRSLLKGVTPEDWRQSTYYRYWMHMAHHWVPAHYGIRTDKHKLIFFYGMRLDAAGCDEPDCLVNTEPGFELYDIEKDPYETVNVYTDPAYAEVVSQLKKQLLELKHSYGDTDEQYPELLALQNKFFENN